MQPRDEPEMREIASCAKSRSPQHNEPVPERQGAGLLARETYVR